MDIKSYLTQRRNWIDRALDSHLPKQSEYPSIIHQAMRYSVFSGGKRIRPILTLASCEASGRKAKEALPAACAIELIHTFSLIHDDLPSIDNDDYRRGKPSCHKKFGEAIAILAGDALLSLSFGLLVKGKDPAIQLKIVHEVSKAVGTNGMLGGQVSDLSYRSSVIGHRLWGKTKNPIPKTQHPKPNGIDQPTLEYIYTRKTGALIAASLKVGAIIGGASPRLKGSLFKFGRSLGLAFQIVDDILDHEGYVLVFGLKESKQEAARLIAKAKGQLIGLGRAADRLGQIADYILTRRA